MMAERDVEPWLRGTWMEVNAVARGVLHALELAEEDIAKWCSTLTEWELNEHPFGLPPVAFQLRHIARSMDRLLTYAEGRQLSGEQLAALKSEMDRGAMRAAAFEEFSAAVESSASRVRALCSIDLDEPRGVGKKQLPTTVGGLLVHVADHTQRHVGQAITTAKILMAQRPS